MPPIYEYMCESCGSIQEEFFHIDEKPTTVQCRKCLKIAHSIISSPLPIGTGGVYEKKRFPYYDESLDRKFNDLKEKKEYLKKHGWVQKE